MSTQPYGPNTADVRHFLVQLAGLGAADRAHVVAAYARLSVTPAWQRAETHLATVIERSGREPARDALTGPLLQLVQRATGDSAPLPAADEDEADVLSTLDPIAEPALAAVLALLVQDLLDGPQASQLLAPFHDVIARR